MSNQDDIKKFLESQMSVNEPKTQEKSTEEEYRVEFSEYKGNKILEIHKGKYKVIGFGMSKAKAILSSVKAIEEFVNANN